jgi:outer membrane biosynthesis protein TonB
MKRLIFALTLLAVFAMLVFAQEGKEEGGHEASPKEAKTQEAPKEEKAPKAEKAVKPEKQEKAPKAEKQEKAPKAEKTPKPAKEDKATKQEEKKNPDGEKRNSKPAKQQTSVAKSSAKTNWDGHKFKPEYFQANYGREHSFNIRTTQWQGTAFHSGSRFMYGGAWFVLGADVPEAWYGCETYIDEYEGGYAIFCPEYPDVQFGVTVVF